MLSLKRNCYSEFFNQEIIVCDENFSYNQVQPLFGGDTYINLTNINTFGTTSQEEYSSDPAQSANANIPQNGTRIANMFISESRFNTGLRFVNPGTEGNTYHHPHDNGEIYLPRMRRDREANQLSLAYNTDYNAQNNLTFSDIFNPNLTRSYRDKFDIARGAPISSEGDIGTWLNFKLNDIYHLNKTKGDVVFLGAGKDFLIIHHQNALFRTRTRTYIDTTGEQAFTGQGDIFENEPEEIVFDEKGALGTQHRWSCIVTKYGYFWIDSDAKKVYKYDNQVSDLTLSGLNNFFSDNLHCVDDNPFTNFGFHLVIDEKNKRLLLSKKHFELKPEYQKSFRGAWKNDKNFLNSLQTNDIIFKDGKYIRIK